MKEEEEESTLKGSWTWEVRELQGLGNVHPMQLSRNMSKKNRGVRTGRRRIGKNYLFKDFLSLRPLFGIDYSKLHSGGLTPFGSMGYLPSCFFCLFFFFFFIFFLCM
jgi:hypothetical protein